MGLDAGPEFDGGSKIPGETKCGIGADAAPAAAYFTDPHGRNADVLGQSILADAHRLQELFQQNFAGMNWGEISHGTSQW